MERSLVKVDKRHHRIIAQEHWGLTDEQMKGMHVHHRIPKSQGGTNDPSNLYVCSPSYHYHAWHGAHGRGMSLIEQATINAKKGAKKGGLRCKELGVGIHAMDHSAKAKCIYAEGKGLAGMTQEERTAASKAGGLVGGKTNAKNKTGVCGISPEEHSKRMASTNKQKWKCPECGFVGNARNVNKHMLEEHGLPKSSKVKW